MKKLGGRGCEESGYQGWMSANRMPIRRQSRALSLAVATVLRVDKRKASVLLDVIVQLGAPAGVPITA
ncbi:MAG: hypothetical protein ACRD8U_05140, partial [Pyrinomonadaceae bacterium]